MGNTDAALYCTSKGAVTIFTKALAVDVARENIRVNCVCPGDIHTPMLEREAASAENPAEYMDTITQHYPVGRVGRPEEVAATICFLASRAAPFVVGAAWSIDGGLTSYSY
jgi:NAD(P)-dependent dehydrogenase (short-subunit alcohol dehydrogenase family)